MKASTREFKITLIKLIQCHTESRHSVSDLGEDAHARILS
jgi:hypothetical protein